MGPESSRNERVARLQRAVGPVIVSRGESIESSNPLVAVTSSRLGHDAGLHRHVCQFLTRCLLDCRQRNASLLVTTGSAIENWAIRAAELFAVPVVKLSVDPNDDLAETVILSQSGEPLSRDAVTIAVADRVDAVYVRRGGTVERCLRARVEDRCDASTRVALSLTRHCAASGLIAVGAIGWFHGSATTEHSSEESSSSLDSRLVQTQSDDEWTRTDGQWLIHCTRRRDGAWPGETVRQYRDSILLGDESCASRSPLDALIRIIRSGRLVAGATATSKTHSVVCFSALPLKELLQRRCFRPQLGRWDYEPYGIAIRLSAAKRLRIQPVIYGETKDRALLPAEDKFRFHPIGKTFDWREEREWRSSESVNLAVLDRDDIRVFAENHSTARVRLQGCPWPITLVAASAPSATPPPDRRLPTLQSAENRYNSRK